MEFKSFFKNGIFAGILAVLIVLIELIAAESSAMLFDALSRTVVPILFIGTIGCLIYAFNDKKSFINKLNWITVVILSTLFLNRISSAIYYILTLGQSVEKFNLLGFVYYLLDFAGYGAVLASLLHNSLKKYACAGFGILAVSALFALISGESYGISLIVINIALVLMSIDKLAKIKKLLRWIVILVSLTVIENLGLHCVVLFIMLAVYSAPFSKIKMNFAKVVSVLLIVMCVMTAISLGNAGDEVEYINSQITEYEEHIEEYRERAISASSSYYKQRYIEYMEDYQEKVDILKEQKKELTRKNVDSIIIKILTIASLACMAIVFWRKMYGKFALISCGLLGLSTLLTVFESGMSLAAWNFDLLSYPFARLLSAPGVWSAILIGVLTLIFINYDKEPKKLRNIAIILSVVPVLLGLESLNIGAYALYAITMICAVLVLVPLTYEKYISVGKHIFFTIITLGIWHLIWVYNVTKNLNEIDVLPKRKARIELLLYMFLPAYSVYWNYKTAEYIDISQKEKGTNVKVLALAFSFILPIIPSVLIQDRINESAN